MTAVEPSLTPADERLHAVLADYLSGVEAGRPEDRDGLLARHPDLAAELDAFFAEQDAAADFAAPIRAILPPEPDAARPGTLGDFRLLREVGRGGMGVVYEAEQLSLNRRVALKILPFAATMDPRHLQRFHNEARAAASLEHPHIVPVHGVGHDRGVHYYAMKFIDGVTLAELIAHLNSPPWKGGAGGGSSPSPAQDSPHPDAQSPPSPSPSLPERGVSKVGDTARALDTIPARRDRAYFRRCAELIADAADAVEYAHSTGVVHRDLKPGNLMLDAAGKIWVTDFGLARVGTDPGLTMSGDLLGTLRYMAPEQALAKHGLVDHRADVYGLGATLYELLTGRPAVSGVDKEEVLRRIAFEEPVAPRKVDKAIPAELETIALKCLAKEPGGRYTAAKELAEDLRRWLNGKPVQAKPPGLRERAVKWGRRHVAAVWTAAAVSIVAALALAASSYLIVHEKRKTDLQFLAARQAVNDMYTDVAEEWLADAPQLTDVQKKFLEKALAFYQQVNAERGDDAAYALEVARAQIRIGMVENKLGRPAPAEAALREATGRCQKLVERNPTNPECLACLGFAWSRLSMHLQTMSQFPEAEQGALEAVDIYSRLVADQPDMPGYWPELGNTFNQLGVTRQQLGQDAEAAGVYKKSLEIRERLVASASTNALYQSDLGGTLHNLACVTPDRTEAERLMTRAIHHQETALKLDPRRVQIRRFLVTHKQNFGTRLRDRGDFEGAKRLASEAIALTQRLAEDYPNVPDYRWMLVQHHVNLSAALHDAKRYSEAVDAARSGTEMARSLVTDFPESPRYVEVLGKALVNLASTSYTRWVVGGKEAGSADRAQELAASAERVDVCQRLLSRWPDDANCANRVAAALADQAVRLAEWTSDVPNAIEAMRRASEYQRKALQARPSDPTYLRSLLAQTASLCTFALRLSQEYQRAGDVRRAEEVLTSNRRYCEELRAEFAEEPGYRDLLADYWISLGNFFGRLNRNAEELACRQRAVELRPDYAPAQEWLGNALAKAGRTEEAILALRKAVELAPDRAYAHCHLGARLTDAGRPAEGLPCFQRAIELDPNAAAAHCNLGIALNKLGRHQEAVAPSRRAIELNPGIIAAYHHLGLALEKTGQLTEALAVYDEALVKAPTDINLRTKRDALAKKLSGPESPKSLERSRLDRNRAEAATGPGIHTSTHDTAHGVPATSNPQEKVT